MPLVFPPLSLSPRYGECCLFLFWQRSFAPNHPIGFFFPHLVFDSSLSLTPPVSSLQWIPPFFRLFSLPSRFSRAQSFTPFLLRGIALRPNMNDRPGVATTPPDELWFAYHHICSGASLVAPSPSSAALIFSNVFAGVSPITLLNSIHFFYQLLPPLLFLQALSFVPLPPYKPLLAPLALEFASPAFSFFLFWRLVHCILPPRFTNVCQQTLASSCLSPLTTL